MLAGLYRFKTTWCAEALLMIDDCHLSPFKTHLHLHNVLSHAATAKVWTQKNHVLILLPTSTAAMGICPLHLCALVLGSHGNSCTDASKGMCILVQTVSTQPQERWVCCLVQGGLSQYLSEGTYYSGLARQHVQKFKTKPPFTDVMSSLNQERVNVVFSHLDSAQAVLPHMACVWIWHAWTTFPPSVGTRCRRTARWNAYCGFKWPPYVFHKWPSTRVLHSEFESGNGFVIAFLLILFEMQLIRKITFGAPNSFEVH